MLDVKKLERVALAINNSELLDYYASSTTKGIRIECGIGTVSHPLVMIHLDINNNITYIVTSDIKKYRNEHVHGDKLVYERYYELNERVLYDVSNVVLAYFENRTLKKRIFRFLKNVKQSLIPE